MKLPPYITSAQKKFAARYIKNVRQTQGYKNALLLEKMLMVAAYGVALNGKINFQQFLNHVYQHICPPDKWVITAKDPNINYFWDVEQKARQAKEKFFSIIPYKTIYFGTKTQVEYEIAQFFSTLLNEENGTHYLKPECRYALISMFKNQNEK